MNVTAWGAVAKKVAFDETKGESRQVIREKNPAQALR